MDSLSLAQALEGGAEQQGRKSTASAIRIPLGLQATESCAPLPGQAPILGPSGSAPAQTIAIYPLYTAKASSSRQGNTMQPDRATVLHGQRAPISFPS